MKLCFVQTLPCSADGAVWKDAWFGGLGERADSRFETGGRFAAHAHAHGVAVDGLVLSQPWG